MSLRRVVIAVLAGILIAPAGATASTRSTTHFRVDTLRADWLFETSTAGTYRYIAVNVYRRTNLDTNKVSVTAVAGKGRCYLSGGALSTCGANMDKYEVLAYEADEAFTNVHVVLKLGRWRHEVTWATGVPYMYVPPFGQQPNLCKGTTTIVYLTAKNATAEGRVFGQKVSTAKETDNFRESENMIQTLEIEECN